MIHMKCQTRLTVGKWYSKVIENGQRELDIFLLVFKGDEIDKMWQNLKEIWITVHVYGINCLNR